MISNVVWRSHCNTWYMGIERGIYLVSTWHLVSTYLTSNGYEHLVSNNLIVISVQYMVYGIKWAISNRYTTIWVIYGQYVESIWHIGIYG